MVMHFVPHLHRRSRSKTNFYVFSYDKISLKFCESFRFFLAVFTEKFPKNPLSELCEKRNNYSKNLKTRTPISLTHPTTVYANYFYDTSDIFCNSLNTYREHFTICIGHDRRTDVIGIDCNHTFQLPM